MGDFFNWLSANPVATITLIVSFGVVITATTMIYVVAFIQGREILFWPPKIGQRPIKNQIGNSSQEIHEVINHQLFLNRKEIHWAMYNDKVSSRYWACGTSLIGVFERGLIQKHVNNGARDIKIILPDTDNSYVSFEQLDKYNQLNIGLIGNQVELAKLAFEKANTIVLADMEISEILKKYSGIMFSNITIFDDDAFIAFYDCTGNGGSNLTLHFNRNINRTGYNLVEAEFLRMWNAQKSLGLKSTKKIGTSIFFVNNANQILLFLRDNKKDIPYPNCWDALGGNVETGETPLECITREMAEEIGTNLESPNLFNVYDMNERIECTFWQRASFDIKKINLKEGQRLKWFTEKDISMMADNDLAFGFRPIMLDFFHQKPYRK